MKRSFILSCFILIILFCGCGKSNSGSINTTPASSQWTIGSSAYKGQGATYDTSSTSTAALASLDLSPGSSIVISFYTHPFANGTYTVTNGSSPAIQNCYIIAVGGGNNYTSTGKVGDKVNVSFTGGKITATFTGVTVSNGTTTTTVSGTIIQQ